MVNEERDTNETVTEPDTGDVPESDMDEGNLAADLAKWKRLSRQHEERAKANADAAKRLAEIEDSKKSEIERAVEAQRAAEQRAVESEQRAMRLEVAAAKGLTPAQAKRLVGTTPEELEADAEELLASFKIEDEEDRAELPRRPRERLRAGTGPAAEPEETDPRKLVANLPRM
jgi:hypothetical protein